jgi:ribonuclease P protein component
MKLTNNKNICPVCGKVFVVEPPVIPNKAPLEEREQFYGGRVHFFKDLVCDCTAEYKALIEKKLVGCEEQLNIIDMIIEKEGVPLDDLARQKLKEAEEMGVQKALQAVHEAIQNNTVMPTITERNKIKRQIRAILAKELDMNSSFDYIFIARRSYDINKFNETASDIVSLLKKVGN